MDYNLLARLEKKGNPSISVKPIFKKNDDRDILDKFLKTQKYLDPKEIFEILKINFNSDKPIGYVLIKNDKDVIGFLGTIFSKRLIEENRVEHCYLHSWIVCEKHRFEAFKLIMPILKKSMFLSTFSPIKTLEGLYKKLGFSEIQFFSKFILFLPNLRFKEDDLYLSDDYYFFEKYLSNKNKIILKDHMFTNTKKMMIYSDKNPNDNLLIIVKKKIKMKILPIIEIIYISDADKFKLYESKISLEFFKKFKTFFLKFNNIEQNKSFLKNSLLLRNIKKKAFYYKRPSNFKFDILYSELTR